MRGHILRMWESIQNRLAVNSRANDDVGSHVVETLKEYKDTINYLEKYDKGEVSAPPSVAKHKDLQRYIQSL
jgi:hypothetical protein